MTSGDDSDVYEMPMDAWEDDDIEQSGEENAADGNCPVRMSNPRPWAKYIWYPGPTVPVYLPPRCNKCRCIVEFSALPMDIDKVIETMEASTGWTFIIETNRHRWASKKHWPKNTWIGLKIKNQATAYSALNAAVTLADKHSEAQPGMVYLSCNLQESVCIGQRGFEKARIGWVCIEGWGEGWMATDMITQAWEAGIPAYWGEDSLRPSWPNK